jgi:hypothetical protein
LDNDLLRAALLALRLVRRRARVYVILAADGRITVL